jgi:PEGA domain
VTPVGEAVPRQRPIFPPNGGGSIPGWWWNSPGYWYGSSYGYYPYSPYWTYGALGLGYFYFDPSWWGYANGYGAGYGTGYAVSSSYGSGYGSGSGSSLIQGNLRIKVKPREAEVRVDGFYAGRVDDFDGRFQKLTLDAGPHRIEIVHPEYQTLTFDVKIREDETIVYEGKLDKR